MLKNGRRKSSEYLWSLPFLSEKSYRVGSISDSKVWNSGLLDNLKLLCFKLQENSTRLCLSRHLSGVNQLSKRQQLTLWQIWLIQNSDKHKNMFSFPDTSFESEVSNDYAIPPDASVDSLAPPSMHSSSNTTMESPRRGGVEKALEKSGYLTKVIQKLTHV